MRPIVRFWAVWLVVMLALGPVIVLIFGDFAGTESLVAFCAAFIVAYAVALLVSGGTPGQ